MKFLKTLFVAFVLFSLTSCENYQFNDYTPKKKRVTDRQVSSETNIEDLTDVDDLEVEVDNFKDILKSDTNCSDYESGVGNFKILGGLFEAIGLKHPVTTIENCVSQAIDEGAAPVCEREKLLLDARKKYSRRDDDEAIEALDQIEEALIVVEEIKLEMEDALWDIIDDLYDATDDIHDDIDNDSSGIERSILRLLTKSELESPARVLRAKANSLCADTQLQSIIED